jgi:putative transposase
MPTGEQARKMRQFSGACRFGYNKALGFQKENHAAAQKFVGYVGMAKRLTEWLNSPDTPWLKDGPVHTQQHALKHLEAAFKNLFAGRTSFPQFRRKGLGNGFLFPDRNQISVDTGNGRIKVPTSLNPAGFATATAVSCPAMSAARAYRCARESGTCPS